MVSSGLECLSADPVCGTYVARRQPHLPQASSAPSPVAGLTGAVYGEACPTDESM
jgi:hypothetical protein